MSYKVPFFLIKMVKVAICTLCINDWYHEIVKYGVETIRRYAKQHNYDFHICNEVYKNEGCSRELPWYKILAIQKILPKYDIVFWIDADGFIMTPEKSIEYFLNILGDKDILCARDWNNELNTGVMIIKNTPFVHGILYEIWNNKEEFDRNFHEQASMGEIYEHNRLNSREKILVIPFENQNILYNFWPNYRTNEQFFLHIARCAHDRIGFIQTMDVYCPIPMNEDVPGEYEDRMNWLATPEQNIRDTLDWVHKKGKLRVSTRAQKYTENVMHQN